MTAEPNRDRPSATIGPLQLIVYADVGVGLAASVSEGKFVQVVLEHQEYLVFAPFARHRFHSQILAEFLEANEILVIWASQSELVFCSPGLRVLGGGRFRADPESRVLKLWDESTAYGRFHEQGLAERLEASEHPWSEYLLEIS
jgi:hypothetical protein